MNTELIRRQERILTEVPTVPAVANHTMVGWLPTDIYIGEFCFVNTEGEYTLFSRDINGIYEIPRKDWTLAQLNSLNQSLSNLSQTVSDLSTTVDGKLDASAYVQHYKGKFTSIGALQTAFPTAIAGDYAQVDSGSGDTVINYNYDTQDGWVIGTSGSSATNTDELPEGSTNTYFTEARVRGTVLTGLTEAGTRTNVSATDTILAAFGKIKKWFTDLHAVAFSGDYNDLANKPDIEALQTAIDSETLEVVRNRGNFIEGDINFNGNTGTGVKDPVNDGDIVNFKTLRTYTSETSVFDLQGPIDLSTFPDFPEAKKGMRWEVQGAGRPNGAPDEWELENWDEIICAEDSSSGDYATVGGNWYFNKARVLGATEETSGTAELATQAEAEAGTDDTRMMTPKKVAQKLTHWLSNVLGNSATKNVGTTTGTVAAGNDSRITGAEQSSNKNATGGYAGLSAFSIVIKNSLGTISSLLTNFSTAARLYTFPDRDITVAGTDEILKKANDLSDVASAATALNNLGVPSAVADGDFLVGQATGTVWLRKTLAQVKTILGLGDAAYKNTGTTAGTVAAGDDSRFNYGKIYDQSVTVVAGTNTTSEEVIAYKMIPGGTLQVGDRVEIRALFIASSGTGTKTCKVKVHSASSVGVSAFSTTANTSSTSTHVHNTGFAVVAASGPNNLVAFMPGGQALMTGIISAGSQVATLPIANDIYIQLTTTKATGTDVISLYMYDIKIFRP